MHTAQLSYLNTFKQTYLAPDVCSSPSMEDPRVPELSHFSELSTYETVEASVDNQLAESVDKGWLTSRKDNEQEMMRIPL